MTGFEIIINNLPVLTVVIPLIAGFLTTITGWIDRRLCWYWVMLTMFVVVLITSSNLLTVINSGTIYYHLGGWMPPFGIEYVIDLLNGFVCLIIAFIGLMVAIYSKESVKKELPGKTIPFYSIFLLLITGLMGMTITGDIFNFYVFLEISSLTAYALIAMGDRGDGLVASFNYLIMGTVAASFILLGIGYLYAVTGTLNMADMQNILPDIYGSKVVLAALAFFMAGFSIKIGLFPLHAWLPDAYTHAPSTASALIAGLMTKVGAYAMIRFMFSVFTPAFVIDMTRTAEILTWAAALAIIMGSVFAIAQSDIKRMLAYSSISQIGYILLGVGLVNVIGMQGGLLHILNHAFMKCALFLVAGAIFYRTGIRNIYQFQGLGKKMPVTTLVFLIAALSMIGVPGTVGFTSKWYLALGSIEAGQWIFVLVILASSLLNVAYFWRIFDNIWFGNPHEKEHIKRDEAPLTMLVPMVILAFLCIFFGFFAYYPLHYILEPLSNTLLGIMP
ncbi:MAG TPA: monovalent cation/H+ antiporter subunit D family protein [Methanosarcinaceae archaeon]|nr:monovalent cation/H+ antiporter subunit D family protein [Methanosarcinaceae archaeon]